MTTEAIITILALAFLLGAVIYLIRKGQQEAEKVFENDYKMLQYFIDKCDINEVNEARIILRLNELNRMKGADSEKLQVLNAEFRRKFSVTLGDIVLEQYNILGLDNPYPLHIVLDKLKWATNYLLHKKNYDGMFYEELNQCVRRAEEIISCLKELNFNHISIKSFLIWLEKEGGNSFIDKDILIDNYLQSRKIKK